MTRVTLSAIAIALIFRRPPGPKTSRTRWPHSAGRGCASSRGKKPGREVKLVVDKTGGYKMGGTGAESSDLATLGGRGHVEGEP